MSTVSDSADEFAKVMIDGTEVALKLTGSLAKEMAIMLIAITKETSKKNKGQTRLNNMLKSNSNLKIFTIKKEDYQDFKKQAKQYGVLYSALGKKEGKTLDGVIDVLVKEEDAVRVNRIVERFNLTTVANIEKEIAEIEKTTQIGEEKMEVQKEIQEKNTSEDLLNKLLKKQNIKEENENSNPSNISSTEKEIQSENLSKPNEKSEGTKKEEKPSLKETIDKIKQEQEEKEKLKAKEETKETPKEKKANETRHKQSKKKKRRKERSK